jgi:hypothetical protein
MSVQGWCDEHEISRVPRQCRQLHWLRIGPPIIMAGMLRHRLHFGPYRTPRFRLGQNVEDVRRGLVRIVGMSDGPIPWPIGQTQRAKSLVLYRGLARAVRRESAAAVAYWFGVTGQTVTKWRKALGIRRTEGDMRLRVAIGKSPAMLPALAAMHAKARDPARRAKIAAARRGKPRPPHVIEAVRKAHTGRKLSAATRAKMSAAHKARGAWPPAAGRAFTDQELRLIRRLPPAEAARLTGRTLTAVYSQRSKLRVAN